MHIGPICVLNIKVFDFWCLQADFTADWNQKHILIASSIKVYCRYKSASVNHRQQ